AGVVDEDARLELTLFQFGNQLLDGVGPRQIERDHVGGDLVSGRELVAERAQLVLAARHQHQIVPALRQLARQIGADSTRSSGHQRQLAHLSLRLLVNSASITSRNSLANSTLSGRSSGSLSTSATTGAGSAIPHSPTATALACRINRAPSPGWRWRSASSSSAPVADTRSSRCCLKRRASLLGMLCSRTDCNTLKSCVSGGRP